MIINVLCLAISLFKYKFAVLIFNVKYLPIQYFDVYTLTYWWAERRSDVSNKQIYCVRFTVQQSVKLFSILVPDVIYCLLP